MPEFVSEDLEFIQPYYDAEDFTTPIESLKADLEFIQTYYDAYRIKDRENAELLIDSYKYAIELLTNAEMFDFIRSLERRKKNKVVENFGI